MDPSVACILTFVDEDTAVVVMVAWALRFPAAMANVAEPIFATAELLLDRVKFKPPVGAADASVTVTVVLAPPLTLAGLAATVNLTLGSTSSVDWLVLPWHVAVTVTLVSVVTEDELMAKEALLLPSGTVTL